MSSGDTLQILDVNLNRVTEGLRVIEDFSRFILLDAALTDKVRTVKHGIWNIVSDIYPEIVASRNIAKDYLADKKESVRKNKDDIPKASFNRVKEGLRVMEELGKLISSDAGYRFKEMRFNIYRIEKEYYGKTAENEKCNK